MFNALFNTCSTSTCFDMLLVRSADNGLRMMMMVIIVGLIIIMLIKNSNNNRYRHHHNMYILLPAIDRKLRSDDNVMQSLNVGGG